MTFRLGLTGQKRLVVENVTLNRLVEQKKVFVMFLFIFRYVTKAHIGGLRSIWIGFGSPHIGDREASPQIAKPVYGQANVIDSLGHTVRSSFNLAQFEL